MTGGKRRLRQLFVTGLEVSPDGGGTIIKEILAGSVSVATAAFSAGDSPSVASTEATISGVTASHTLVVSLQSGSSTSACLTLRGACPGAGVANIYWQAAGASAREAVAAGTATIRYLAFQT